MCVRERDSVCVCVCERERDSVCVCECVLEREKAEKVKESSPNSTWWGEVGPRV